MSIAYDHLKPIEQYYIRIFYPHLIPIERCKNCGGNIIENHGNPECLQCSAEHDSDGELVPTYSGIKVTKEQMSKGGIDNEY